MIDDGERVERLTRQRARVCLVFGALFLVTQAASVDADAPTRPAALHVAAWMVWTALLLLFLVKGGALWRGRGVRHLLNDETTAAHRTRALVTGFWCAIASAAALYALSFAAPVTARAATRLVITVAVGAALLRFGLLERRALGHG